MAEKKVVDYAVEVLAKANWPMHITDLIVKMQQVGWSTTAQSLRHTAQASIHGYVHRKGEASPIVLLGGGMLTTKEIAATLDREKWTPQRKTERKARDKHSIRIVQSDVPESERRCGNCKFIEYDGPDIVFHRSGTCARVDFSQPIGEGNRFTVYPNGYHGRPCVQWQQRTADQIRKDTNEALVDRLLMNNPSKWGEKKERRERKKERRVPRTR